MTTGTRRFFLCTQACRLPTLGPSNCRRAPSLDVGDDFPLGCRVMAHGRPLQFSFSFFLSTRRWSCQMKCDFFVWFFFGVWWDFLTDPRGQPRCQPRRAGALDPESGAVWGPSCATITGTDGMAATTILTSDSAQKSALSYRNHRLRVRSSVLQGIEMSACAAHFTFLATRTASHRTENSWGIPGVCSVRHAYGR